ncbi:MAG: gliding motility-associated C-terminal domain-containing protein, partial [Cyclobacteriaceae bacterium]|nr:gliding motility-associated C-terminal domain-containing protein [Cyclobacteriaceae bacterium]
MNVNSVMMRVRFGLLILVLMMMAYSAGATHLRAGEITIRRENCTSLTFIITITVYTNTGSEIKFGSGVLDYGDGSQPHVTPTIDNTLRPDLGPNIGTVSYSISHTYAGPGRFVVSYLEPNRNAGILNMFNSVETRFYLESTVNIDPFLGCNNSPRLLVAPIDKGCTGAAFYHNPGAFDPDGDSLSYEFTIPKRDKNIDVNNYRNPNVREFYDRIGLNYGAANETSNGPPTFTINPITGTIIWDAPGAPGEYNIAFAIREWRKVAGIWINQGYVIRDMQIIVEDCKNKRPELQVPPDICVEAGKRVTAEIFGTDPDNDSVKIEAFSQVFSIQPSPATYTPNPARNQATGPSRSARLVFTWNTRCEHIKDQPYQVVFKITDKPANGPKLVQFKTWNIRVVGPAPRWTDAKTIPAKRQADLQWKPYACTNAEVMQVWRRVDTFVFTPPECVTGIPDFLGYTKIAEVPITQSKFTDTNNGAGLAVGARYCYRLLAVFPLPGGGESYVSRDTCLAPILADAPVVTNVTVDRTSTTAGRINVRWRPPFDISKTQFPPPYRYKVFRAEGLAGNLRITSPHTGTLADTTYTDTDINTEELAYNYRIVLYDNTNQPIDTSAVASSVRLEAKPQFKRIELNWTANVPWSNQS